MRARSRLANEFADAGLQVNDKVLFFTKIVLDAITEFQFPDFGSIEVPNLLKPGFHGSTNFNVLRKFIQTLIF